MNLTAIFTFLIAFGGVLFLVRPDPTPGQTAFRLLMVAAGVVGLLTLRWRKPPR